MIIITTTTKATIFENEDEVKSLVYNHSKKGLVLVYYKEGTPKQIEYVESVRYVNNAQPCDFNVEISELTSLKKELEIEQAKSWAYMHRYSELLFDINKNNGEYPQSVIDINNKLTKDLESIKEQFNLKTL